MRLFLLRVFGTRVLAVYGCISMLSVAVLAALYITSGYAIEGYVTDQIRRIPWDISIIQRGEAHRYRDLQKSLRQVRGVQRIETMGFLRVRNTSPLRLEIDGREFPVRWFGLIAASEPQLLPPELRRHANADAPHAAVTGLQALGAGLRLAALDEAGPPGHQHTPGMAMPPAREYVEKASDYQVALIAAQRSDAGGSLGVGPGSYLRLAVAGEAHEHGGGVDDHSAPHMLPLGQGETVFAAHLTNKPVQLERQEFNKWILRDIGSLSYLPEEAVIVSVPISEFESIATRFGELFLSSEGIHGGEAPPPYVPEVAHLVRIDRSGLVSPWELDDSLARVTPVIQKAFETAQWMTPFSYVNSDLHTMLKRMRDVSRLIGLVTLLVAIPLLWLGWVLAKTLSGLLLLNERRLIGLTLIRGIPIEYIGQALMMALLAGGLVGGLLGLVTGTGLPVLGYTAAGHPIPPWSVLWRGLAYFALFLVLGLLLAYFSGRGMMRYVRSMTPREAMARVAGSDAEAVGGRLSVVYVGACFVALALGGYKLASWIAGHSLLMRAVTNIPEKYTAAVFLTESGLNFVAVPLFLFGLTGLLLWRIGWLQKMMSGLTAPIVGALHWFVGQHMTLSRHRVSNMLFVASLAMALTLLPQVAADTFYGRVLRGVRASLGGDIQVEFNMAELAGEQAKPVPVSEYRRGLKAPAAAIAAALRADPGVAGVTALEQFVVPGVYIPGQSGLMLDVVDAPADYLKTVYYEDGLGITRPFPAIIGALDADVLPVSQGLLHLRKIPLHQPIVLGYGGDDAPIPVQFGDILSFLPGQPATGVTQREGYVAAEIDYLNYILSSDARIMASADRLDRAPLSGLKVLPSRQVFVVKAREGVPANKALADRLAGRLPLRPTEVRWQELEEQRVSKDMFISLAIENMKVFMIGGLVLALASVMAIGLANFMSEKRMFALLRLRGVPKPLLLRVSLSMFLTPIVVGIVLGIVLGAVSGYGMSQAVWDLPRIYGVAGLLLNRLVFSLTAWAIVAAFSIVLTGISLGFGLWPFRRTAREAIREY